VVCDQRCPPVKTIQRKKLLYTLDVNSLRMIRGFDDEPRAINSPDAPPIKVNDETSPVCGRVRVTQSSVIRLPSSSPSPSPEPIIRFAETKFSLSEPKEAGGTAVVRIPLVRLGDTSKVSVVRVHTKDGSAVSGEDYNPISQGRASAWRTCVSLLSLWSDLEIREFFFFLGGRMCSCTVFYCTIFGFLLQFYTLNAISALLFT